MHMGPWDHAPPLSAARARPGSPCWWEPPVSADSTDSIVEPRQYLMKLPEHLTSYLACEQHVEHSEQDSAHARVRAQISLSCSPWRARGQHEAPAIAGTRYCVSAYARPAARTSALCDCCASAVALQTWAPQRASGSRGPSRRWPIGKLRPGRCRLATQI